MTRFARAKGSKASNERLPERATSWKIMQEDLMKSQKEAEVNKEREKMNQRRQEKYEEFLEETEKNVEKKWADFPETKSPNMKGKSPLNKTKQNLKSPFNKNRQNVKSPNNNQKQKDNREEEKMLTENSISEDMLDEMCASDSDIDEQIAKMKENIEGILKRDQHNAHDASDTDDGDDSDDAPEEATAKEEPKVVAVKKQKMKKHVLKIKSVNQESTDEEEGDNMSGALVKIPASNKKKNKNTKKNKQQNNNQKQDQPDESKTIAKSPLNQNKKQLSKQQKKNAGGGAQKEEQNDNVGKKGQKRQLPKVRDNKEHKRRKPDNEKTLKLFVNGQEEELVRYHGFPIRKTDVERLEELRKSMISKGIPRSSVERTMKIERRKAEKLLSRIRKLICFQCRKPGHVLSECPELNQGQQFDTAGSGICFKCGSTEHSHLQCKMSEGYKFATCFICREQGHIAKECPDNPRGLYPQGGACKLCGDVTHLKKDCPTFKQEQHDNTVFVNTISGGNIDSLDGEEVNKSFAKQTPTKNKVVKF